MARASSAVRNRLDHLVDERLGLRAPGRGRLGDVDAVLVGAGQETRLVALHPVPAGDRVRSDDLEQGVEAGAVVRVGDGGRQVEPGTVGHGWEGPVAGGRGRREGERRTRSGEAAGRLRRPGSGPRRAGPPGHRHLAPGSVHGRMMAGPRRVGQTRPAGRHGNSRPRARGAAILEAHPPSPEARPSIRAPCSPCSRSSSSSRSRTTMPARSPSRRSARRSAPGRPTWAGSSSGSGRRSPSGPRCGAGSLVGSGWGGAWRRASSSWPSAASRPSPRRRSRR